MSIPTHGPIVLLRCKKCGRKTDHVLISLDNPSKKEQIEETYECQECGETKKIYEFTISYVDRLLQHSAKKKNLEDLLKKDFMEGTSRKKKNISF